MLGRCSLLVVFCGTFLPVASLRAETQGTYVLSPDGTVLRFFEQRGTWLPLGRPFQKLLEGGGRLFAIHANNDIYELDVARSRSIGDSPSGLELWTRIGTSGHQFIVDDRGQLCGIAPGQTEIWCYRDSPMSWTQVGGAMGKLLVHGKTLYGISPNSDGIYRYEGRPFVWTRLDAPPPVTQKVLSQQTRDTVKQVAARDGGRCYYTTAIRHRCTGIPYDTSLDTEVDQICNGCLSSAHCAERPGGRCIEIAGGGCTHASKACAYPGDPCHARGAPACPANNTCINNNGRAVCGPIPTSPP